jgi:hypothetical protein
MPKFSIYIPDDLWADAQAAEPEAKASALVQGALKRLIDAKGRKGYASLPDDVMEARARVFSKAAERARESYVNGYRIGLRFIEEFPWEAIEDFQRVGWDIAQWDAELSNAEYPCGEDENGATLSYDFDSFWESIAQEVLSSTLAQLERPAGPLREGFIDAFRDVFSEATQAARYAGTPAPTVGVEAPSGDESLASSEEDQP